MKEIFEGSKGDEYIDKTTGREVLLKAPPTSDIVWKPGHVLLRSESDEAFKKSGREGVSLGGDMFEWAAWKEVEIEPRGKEGIKTFAEIDEAGGKELQSILLSMPMPDQPLEQWQRHKVLLVDLIESMYKGLRSAPDMLPAKDLSEVSRSYRNAMVMFYGVQQHLDKQGK